MGNRYSFVEYPILEDSDITINYHVSILKIPSKSKEVYSVTSFIHYGELVLCVRGVNSKQNSEVNYKICKALIATLDDGNIKCIKNITIDNNSIFTITYNDNTTDTYIKHININNCLRDNNYYLIKTSIQQNKKISESSDE